MRFIKRGVIGVLIGQIMYLFTRDKKFKKHVNDAKGREKAKVVGEEVFAFNKEVLTHLRDYDYDKLFHNAKQTLKEKEQYVAQKINELKQYARTHGEHKVRDIADDIEEHALGVMEQMKEKLESYHDSLEEHHKKTKNKKDKK